MGNSPSGPRVDQGRCSTIQAQTPQRWSRRTFSALVSRGAAALPAVSRNPGSRASIQTQDFQSATGDMGACAAVDGRWYTGLCRKRLPLAFQHAQEVTNAVRRVDVAVDKSYGRS